MREISFKTAQEIKMFDVLVLDGQMIQKIGFSGDYEIFDVIPWDETIDTTELQIDLITEFCD